MHSSKNFVSSVCFSLALFAPAAFPQSLVILSGNGQVVQEQFSTNMPMVVQARGALGTPAAGVSIAWSISQGQGTLVGRTDITDQNGLASTKFLATTLQPGTSFLPATVTATTQSGAVGFVVTTTALRTPTGSMAAFPQVELVAPPLDNRVLTGRAGSTLPAAVSVRVVAISGFQAGQPVPNVGLRIVNADDPASTPVAACNAAAGTVLTDATGIARCDLTLTSAIGITRIAGLVGEYQYTPAINLDITPGAACAFTLSQNTYSAAAGGGSASVGVTAQAGCTWTAATNASWIAISSGSSGSGNGTVAFAVSANSGAARTGTLTIGGQTFTINQAAASAGTSPLSISTPAGLPGGQTGAAYSATILATGGRTPYQWSVTGTLPPGLTLTASSGVVSGVPTTAGTYGFTATVMDAAGTAASQAFTIAVTTPGTGGGGPSTLTITNASFPSGNTGQAYRQVLTSAGGCSNPFGPVPVFTLASGSLPPGLSVAIIADRTYGISGTPTTNGTYSFGLRVTDTCGASATGNFTITIGPGGGATVPQLGLSPSLLTFTVNGAGIFQQNVTVTSTPAGNFSASASTIDNASWLSVNPPSGNTPATLSVTVNTAGLRPGNYSGFITVTPAGGAAQQVRVNLTVIEPSIFTVAPVQLAFKAERGLAPAEQTLTVASTGGPLNFRVVSQGNFFSVTPTGATTPGTLRVAANSQGLAAGVHAGAITIFAEGETSPPPPVTIIVTFSVTEPAPTVTGVKHGASFLTGPVAPGEIIAISGSNLGPGELAVPDTAAGFVPNLLAETRVFFDGIPAPILHSSSRQVAVIVPYAMEGRTTAKLQVEHRNTRSIPVDVIIAESAPGIFVLDSAGQGAILNQDSTVNALSNGAEPGSIVSIYATGEGATDPSGQDGRLTGDVLAKPKLRVGVIINGEETEVLYAGSAPGLPAGALQVNARVPASVPRGAFVEVRLRVGNALSQPGVKLATKP